MGLTFVFYAYRLEPGVNAGPNTAFGENARKRALISVH
jgi:hypothetical protein